MGKDGTRGSPGTATAAARAGVAMLIVAALGFGSACQAVVSPAGSPADDAPSSGLESGADATAGRATDSVGLEGLNATLWVQTAVEYRASALQSYELAGLMLERALTDPSWTAALEQTGDFSGLPPAVVLDVDETVLDNGPYQARLILDREVFGSESWDAWVEERAAGPVPGALEFCTAAAERGVTVFYVTNRDAHLEEATRANLASLGFPVDEDVDTVLTRGETQEWDTSDKTPRRRAVATGYRILLLVGDNMGDFAAASEGTVAERLEFAREHRDAWGTRWITLPNPQYGSWEGTVLGFDYSRPREEVLDAKHGALDPAR